MRSLKRLRRRYPPFRAHHAVKVVRRRLPADEDDGVALLPAVRGRVGVEDDRAGGRPRRGVEAVRDDVDLRIGVDHGVQQLVELCGVDPNDGLLLGDQALLDHVDGDLQRGGGGPLAGARL